VTPNSFIPYKIRRWTGFKPSLTSGSARETITLIAYSKNDLRITLERLTPFIRESISSAILHISSLAVRYFCFQNVLDECIQLPFSPAASACRQAKKTNDNRCVLTLLAGLHFLFLLSVSTADSALCFSPASHIRHRE